MTLYIKSIIVIEIVSRTDGGDVRYGLERRSDSDQKRKRAIE